MVPIEEMAPFNSSTGVRGEFEGFPFRANPVLGESSTGEVDWLVEYQQSPTYDWGPRGSFSERDGLFTLGGNRTANTAYSALRLHAAMTLAGNVRRTVRQSVETRKLSPVKRLGEATLRGG